MRFPLFALILCVLLPITARADEAPRPSKPMFKGVELYSWRDAKNERWLFSILPGTNRNKTTKEIKERKNVIVGAEKLKQRLAQLAVGEQVFWFVADAAQFAYPPKTVRDDIVKTAKQLRIELYTSSGKA